MTLETPYRVALTRHELRLVCASLFGMAHSTAPEHARHEAWELLQILEETLRRLEAIRAS